MFILFISLVNLIVYSCNIKPNCGKCRWYVPHINNNYGQCKLFLFGSNMVEYSNSHYKETNSYYNKLFIRNRDFPIYKYSHVCRQKESLCGKDGKYFEKKKEIIKGYNNFKNSDYSKSSIYLKNKNINSSYDNNQSNIKYIKKLINDYSIFINNKNNL